MLLDVGLTGDKVTFFDACDILRTASPGKGYHQFAKTSISRICRIPDAIQSCTMRPTTLHESFNSRLMLLNLAQTL